MELKKLSFIMAGIAAAVFTAFPVQASGELSQSVVNANPQIIQEESSAAVSPITYFGSEVQEAYTYNPKGLTYHKISDQKQLALLIKFLESGKTKSPKAGSEGGFLLVTANGKHEIYIDSQEKELLTLCQNNNAVSPGLVKWLVFMSTDRITYAEFRDWEVGLKRKDMSFNTDDPSVLKEVSKTLKSLKVKGAGTRTRENPPTGSDGPFYLKFNTGVSYSILINRNKMDIYSSDMDYHILYELQDGEWDRALKTMREIGKKNPTYILPVRQLDNKVDSVRISGTWGDNFFHSDTSSSQKIEKILKVLKTMRVYGVGIFTDNVARNPMTSSYNGFEAYIIYHDGTRQKFEDYNGELWVYTYDNKDPKFQESAVYGYQFTEESHKALYDALSQAVR